ncbi:MAG: hypothetical protein JXQ73_13715 [Phycisphaerae bacterium]|nr:hypothetical protein [Phycisphaerae bacterium]
MLRTSIRRASGVVTPLVGVVLISLSGCLPSPPPEKTPGSLVSVGPARTITADEVRQQHDQLLVDRLGDPPTAALEDPLGIDWQDLIEQALVNLAVYRKITYMSRDADGNPIELTGMLYLPRRGLRVCPMEVPLIAYPHGTELKKDQVPSNNAGDEFIFGAAGAIFGGFAVAMPDLPGMGGADPNRYHPYCHADSLAYSVVDMIRAVRQYLEETLPHKYRWNGRLYIMGYSEGGYAAMATVREIQLRGQEYGGLSITGSACMAGPYDLSGVMRRTMIDPNVHFPRPFFLPYMVMGYNAVYGGAFDPNGAMSATLLPDIISWMDGSREGSDVDTLIMAKLGLVPPNWPVPQDLFNASWVAEQIADDVYETSEVGQLLTANNLWSGWVPNRPMLMRQSPDDDLVPYENSLVTVKAFEEAGVGDLLTFRPIGKKGDGIGHVEGAVIGIPSAMNWFKKGCPKL